MSGIKRALSGFIQQTFVVLVVTTKIWLLRCDDIPP